MYIYITVNIVYMSIHRRTQGGGARCVCIPLFFAPLFIFCPPPLFVLLPPRPCVFQPEQVERLPKEWFPFGELLCGYVTCIVICNMYCTVI